MKSKLLVLVCFILICPKARSQSDSRYLTIVYSPKISFFTSDIIDYKTNRQPLLKNDIGFKVYLSKKENFKFVTGLILTNKGWKDNFIDEIITRNYKYLSIPLILDFKFLMKNKISYYFSCGLSPEILIDYDKKINPNESYDIDSKHIGYWDYTSCNLGLKLNYKINDQYCFIIEPNLNYQLFNNYHRRLYDYGLEFSFGYRY